MNSKERVLRTINRQETDRVPFDMFGTSLENIERIRAFMKIPTYPELYRVLGIDIWTDWGFADYIGESRLYKGKAADYWGVPYESQDNGDSSNLAPLMEISSIDEVESYKWPNPNDFSFTRLIKEIEKYRDMAIVGGVWAPIFHNVTWLCGFETTLMNLAAEPEISEALIRHVTDFWVGYTKNLLEAAKGKIDIIQNCNDFGAQNSMIMNPELFRKFFKPALKRIHDTTKEYGAKAFQHCCGSIFQIIPDFIEIGVDVLNPIQITAKDMDPVKLKKEFGNKLIFDGGIDTQYILPNGSTEDVKQEVKKMLDILDQNGGYILGGSQGLESDISVENIIAMYEEGKKQGR